MFLKSILSYKPRRYAVKELWDANPTSYEFCKPGVAGAFAPERKEFKGEKMADQKGGVKTGEVHL